MTVNNNDAVPANNNYDAGIFAPRANIGAQSFAAVASKAPELSQAISDAAAAGGDFAANSSGLDHPGQHQQHHPVVDSQRQNPAAATGKNPYLMDYSEDENWQSLVSDSTKAFLLCRYCNCMQLNCFW